MSQFARYKEVHLEINIDSTLDAFQAEMKIN